jgi:hypothetical protein
MNNILLPYIHYVALYLGVALTGGSVVHLPLAPGRYLLIGCIGVIVFIVASMADARRRHATAVEGENASLGRYVGWSVVLSVGLGMLSGSIQHFLHDGMAAGLRAPGPEDAAAIIRTGWQVPRTERTLPRPP